MLDSPPMTVMLLEPRKWTRRIWWAVAVVLGLIVWLVNGFTRSAW
jgi:hypothetical protein